MSGSDVTSNGGNLMDLLRKDMNKQTGSNKYNNQSTREIPTDDDFLLQNTNVDKQIYPDNSDDDLIILSDDEKYTKREEMKKVKRRDRGDYDVHAKRQRVLDIARRANSGSNTQVEKSIPKDIKVLKNGRWLQISTGKLVKPEDMEHLRNASDVEILDEVVGTGNDIHEQMDTIRRGTTTESDGNKFFVQLSEEERMAKVKNRIQKMNNIHRKKQVAKFIKENDKVNNDISLLSRRATDSILLDNTQESRIREDRNGNLFISSDKDSDDEVEITGESGPTTRRQQIQQDLALANQNVRDAADDIFYAEVLRDTERRPENIPPLNSTMTLGYRLEERRKADMVATYGVIEKFPAHLRDLFTSSANLQTFLKEIGKKMPKEYIQNEDRMRQMRRLYVKYNEYLGNGRFDHFMNDRRQQRLNPLAAGHTRIHMFDRINPVLGHEETIDEINERIEHMENIQTRVLERERSQYRMSEYERKMNEAVNVHDGVCSDFKDEVPVRQRVFDHNNPKVQYAEFENDGPIDLEVKSKKIMNIRKKFKKVNICMLCAVPLRDGIPESFKGCRSKDQSFEYLARKHDVPCPYVALTAPTETDRTYSKRLFISTSCGHAYCGRCVMRISNSSKLPDKLKQRRRNAIGCANPYIYGPMNCVAEGCHATFNTKNAFREVFL